MPYFFVCSSSKIKQLNERTDMRKRTQIVLALMVCAILIAIGVVVHAKRDKPDKPTPKEATSELTGEEPQGSGPVEVQFTPVEK